jgi:hypothetical protein
VKQRKKASPTSGRRRPVSAKAPSLMEEIDREKQASRDADARDLASGRKSVEQLVLERGILRGRDCRVDFKSAKRLW